MSLSALHISSKDVKSELLGNKDILRIFGGDKKIIVPKTMIVGNKEDNFRKLLLFSSLDHERYKQDCVAKELGYKNTAGITHESIDTLREAGRVTGECSLVLESRFLGRFAKVVMSTELKDAMRRKNAVVAYSLGDKTFLLLPGMEFIKIYTSVLEEFRISHNL